MPDIVVQLPSRGISVSFPDDATPEEIQSILDRDFPRNGQDVAYALNDDPEFGKSVSNEDFSLYEKFMDEKKTEWASTAASAAGYLVNTISKGLRGLFDINNLNPANAGATIVESGAQGTRQLYGMLAQSDDPGSLLFKFKDWINGTGTLEERKSQWQEARRFAEQTRQLDEGKQTVTGIDPALVNNDLKNLIAIFADPMLLVPGFGEALGAGRLATRAVGAGVEAAGKASQVLTRPMVAGIAKGAELAADVLGTEGKTLRGIAAGTGVSGAVMGLPGAATAVGAVGAIEGADILGRVMERAGQQLADAPTRIGALESLALKPNAGAIEKALAKVGRYGADDAIDLGLRSTTGGLEGAAIGTSLGYLNAREEGAAAGFGTGAVLGGAGSGLVRGVQKATGAAALEARVADYHRFYKALDAPNKAVWDSVLKESGITGAVRGMDIASYLSGKLGDAEMRFLTDQDFVQRFGNRRGVAFAEGERPVAYINAGRFSSDATAGHELFHVLKNVEQLRPQAERIEQAIVGLWGIDAEGKSVPLVLGLLSEADMLARFDSYKDALKPGPEDEWSKANTMMEKAKLVGEELASEYMDKLIRGSNPDAMLRGFDGITRQLVDRALIQSSEGMIRRVAQRFGLGSDPIESITFKKLPQATPAMNAMLRDLVRARRTLNERVKLADDSGYYISKRDLSNPIIAADAERLGLVERQADGTVKWKSEDVLNAQDHAQNESVKNVLERTAVADTSKPHARVVDGVIVADGIAPEQLAAILASPVLPDKLKQSYRIASQALADGEVIFVRNGKATKEVTSKLTGKKLKRYNDGVRITEREIRPYELTFNKAGEPYLRNIDITKLRGAAMDLAARNRLGPWAGDFKGFYQDFLTYLKNLGDVNSRTHTSDLPGFTPEKAAFMHDFFGRKDGSSSKFIRNLTLDRMVEMRPTGERIEMSDGEQAWRQMKNKWQPAENVGDGQVIRSDNGYQLIQKNGKWISYRPNGERLGIDATQAKAEARVQQHINLSMSLSAWKKRVGTEDRKAIIEAEKRITQVAKDNPEAIRLEVQRDKSGKPKIELLTDSDDNPILDNNGKQVRGVVFTKEQYDLRNAPGLSKDDNVAVQQGAALLEANARESLANPAVKQGIGWYARMRNLLQGVFGADIEIFGQLLGATSARTPVDTNFKQALEAIKLFSSGKYDDLVQKYHEHVTNVKSDAASGKLFEDWRKRNPKKRDSEFKQAAEIRKRINDFDEVPLRSNGAKYNANSMKVLQVLYGNWIDQTVGPKTPNFAGNLTGRVLAATIDVWAARNLRRLLYEGKQKKWRLLPEQEDGVAFTLNNKGVYGGDFVFAQRIYDEVSKRLGMNADDLQALMWFAEKDVWEKNGWTNSVGAEKSSFDKEAGKLITDRFQAGVTTFRDRKSFSKEAHAATRQDLQTKLASTPGVVAARVTESSGLYGGSTERSFDVEFTVKKGVVPTDVIREVLAIGKRENQSDVFVSKVVEKTDPNARPGIEIGFKSPAGLDDLKQVIRAFRNAGIDGFTVAKDRRGNVIGIRAQYVPEISGRYDQTHLDLSVAKQRAIDWMTNAKKAKASLKTDNVSYAKETYYSTHVFGRGEYDTPVTGDLFRGNARNELGRRQQLLERERAERLLREQQAARSDNGGRPQAPRGNDEGPSASAVKFQPAAPDTPEFKKWFGESKVVDAEGKPKVVYHGGNGSPTDFSAGSSRGIALAYFSDTPDVASKYALGGGISWGMTVDDYIAALNEGATSDSRLSRRRPAITPVYLAIKNPVTERTTLRQLFSGDAAKARRSLEDFSGSFRELLEDVENFKYDGENISDSHFWELADKHFDDVFAKEDTKAMPPSMAVTASLAANDNSLGFDGIIYSDREAGGDTYVVFEPTQIKSATGNKGTFDATNPDIRFQPAENLPYGKVWRGESGLSIVQKDGGKFRVYSPLGLIGIVATYEAAEQLANKHLR